MRTVCWSQVSDHTQKPGIWNEVEVDDAADATEVKDQVLEDGSFAHPPELRLLLNSGSWLKWDKLRALPSGDLKVKVICPAAGIPCVHLGNMLPCLCTHA